MRRGITGRVLTALAATLAATLAASGAARAQAATPDGAALFLQNCAICHQKGATGLAGQFPRLAGRVGPLSSHPEGLAYLVDVLTYGMAGTVTVDGAPILGAMPSFAALPDEQVAAILRYLAGLGGGGKPPTSAQIAQLRARDKKDNTKSATDVLAERKQLAATGILP